MSSGSVSSIVGSWQDNGIKDGSESRQNGTTWTRDSLTEEKVRGSEGFSTVNQC